MGGFVSAAACRCSLWGSSPPPTVSSAERLWAWLQQQQQLLLLLLTTTTSTVAERLWAWSGPVSRRSSWSWCLAGCRQLGECDGSGRVPARCLARPPLHAVVVIVVVVVVVVVVSFLSGHYFTQSWQWVTSPCHLRRLVCHPHHVRGLLGRLLMFLDHEGSQDEIREVLDQKMCR